jgi:UDP-N-acetylglucosamine enolpyruvyl transferase
VADAFHVDRGYQSFVETLTSLGAQVRRITDETLI